MTDLQLELTRLIGSKELTFGCFANIESQMGQKRMARIVAYSENGFATFESKGQIMTQTTNNRRKTQWKIIEIIGHPATLSDLHMWLNNTTLRFEQEISHIKVGFDLSEEFYAIGYDSSLDLIAQPNKTLETIINIIKETGQ